MYVRTFTDQKKRFGNRKGSSNNTVFYFVQRIEYVAIWGTLLSVMCMQITGSTYVCAVCGEIFKQLCCFDGLKKSYLEEPIGWNYIQVHTSMHVYIHTYFFVPYLRKT